ncbi:MAG TPA: MgtC/SapB family protein [Stenomitos sp.]
MQIGILALELLISTVLSGAIGMEREWRNKAAGFRTHVLVGLGSTLLTHLSLHAFAGGDPSRIAAQVVTGIGFIGAGAILQRGHFVRGVTTAATLWVTMSVAMAVGVGWYGLAAMVTGIVLLVLMFFEQLEVFLPPRRLRSGIRLRVMLGPEEGDRIGELLKESGGKLRRGEWVRTADGQRVRLSATFFNASEEDVAALAKRLVDRGASEVEWTTAEEEP